MYVQVTKQKLVEEHKNAKIKDEKGDVIYNPF